MFQMPKYPVPRWVLKRMNWLDHDGWFEAYKNNTLDFHVDNSVRWILFELRSQRAIQPYLYIFKLAWEVIRGKYRRAAKKVHSGSDATSGSGSGAGGATVAQFTRYGGGFTSPGAFNPGANSGLVQAGFASTIMPGGGTPIATASPARFADAGIKAGEIKAYRCWHLGGDGLLRSVVIADHIWEPGKIVEGDAAGGYGIYAYKSVLLLSEYGKPEPGYVTGTIDMWGDVYEYERGYRAQYAVIASIDDSPYYDAKALRKLYGLTRKRKKK